MTWLVPNPKFRYVAHQMISWKVQEELHRHFLSGVLAKNYWENDDALSQYDLTFGRRIFWKWEAILNGLRDQGYHPTNATLLDWGCGTGVATEALLAAWPEAFQKVFLYDRSARAEAFAKAKLSPVPVQSWRPGDEVPSFLAISHVLNELNPVQKNALLDLASQADTILWVEPGTPFSSDELTRIRARLAPEFTIIAPCPHQGSCGLGVPRTLPDWCHSYISPPSEVFHTAFWKKWGERLGIDLRSVTASYLVLSRSWKSSEKSRKLLGRPRKQSGAQVATWCTADGIKTIDQPRPQAT